MRAGTSMIRMPLRGGAVLEVICLTLICNLTIRLPHGFWPISSAQLLAVLDQEGTYCFDRICHVHFHELTLTAQSADYIVASCPDHVTPSLDATERRCNSSRRFVSGKIEWQRNLACSCMSRHTAAIARGGGGGTPCTPECR
jgi:hypothetical protein